MMKDFAILSIILRNRDGEYQPLISIERQLRILKDKLFDENKQKNGHEIFCNFQN